MNIKNLILGVVIAVIFFMFCVYGTKLIYKAPNYSDFCNNSYSYPAKIMPLENCTSSNQIINEKSQQCWSSRGVTNPVYDEKGCEIDVKCDYCSLDYDKADEAYSKNLFIVSVIFGIVVIGIALFLQLVSVSGGLMLGSLAYIIYGTARYWRFMNDWVRFIILGVALIALIFLAYYVARRETKKNEA